MSLSARELAFVQVDVFTDRVFGGNPLAVFPDGGGLTTAQMQAVAREMNLSETVFVLPTDRDDCDVRLRIFTPGQELPFAGHPTIGTAYVMREQRAWPPEAPRFVFEEGVGPVPVWLDTDGARIWMAQRPATLGEPLADRSTVAAVLGLDDIDLLPRVPIQVVSSGNPFLFAALRDRTAVDRAELDQRRFVAALGDHEAVGAFVFAVDTDRVGTVYSRMLSGRGVGIDEDPATGSASGPLGAFLVAYGLVPHADVVEVVSHQGVAMGRPSEVHVRVHTGDGRLEVGGGVVPVLTGTLMLPVDA